MPKPKQCYYFTNGYEDKWVHTFLKNICLKVNVIARLEFKAAFYEVTSTLDIKLCGIPK